ncbi:hypothetical protein [Clostridium beijerinckii]|uniref:hypothetical protein n=1 Tax=Clostridium beijerinckii TaxID=1520 RepID=UPI000479FCAC|nr:hypothetical protein [Clostridium beijerinckii]
MSWDCAVWHCNSVKSKEDAANLYKRLCEGDTSLIGPTQKIQDFYEELTANHPEVDDISEEEIGDLDLCPWSVTFDKSEGHIIMSCVLDKADYVSDLVRELAQKHELSFYEPQNTIFIYK